MNYDKLKTQMLSFAWQNTNEIVDIYGHMSV